MQFIADLHIHSRDSRATAKDLDLIILATITPDTCCPSGANWLQAKLEADVEASGRGEFKQWAGKKMFRPLAGPNSVAAQA